MDDIDALLDRPVTGVELPDFGPDLKPGERPPPFAPKPPRMKASKPMKPVDPIDTLIDATPAGLDEALDRMARGEVPPAPRAKVAPGRTAAHVAPAIEVTPLVTPVPTPSLADDVSALMRSLGMRPSPTGDAYSPDAFVSAIKAVHDNLVVAKEAIREHAVALAEREANVLAREKAIAFREAKVDALHRLAGVMRVDLDDVPPAPVVEPPKSFWRR